MTCLPGFFMNPAEDTVGEMIIPFVSQRKYMDLAPRNYTDSDLPRLQGMEYSQLIGKICVPLRNNNAIATSVSYTVLAWMTEVELAVPTPYLSLQAGPKVKKIAKDEYGKGPVSGPASVVASIAGKLVDAPVIGPLARATEIGAGAVASIAHIFGFSRPSVIGDSGYFRQRPFSSFASGFSGDTTAKLTLDPKNEVFVSPSTVGLENVDEMSFEYILGHDGYLQSVAMGTSDTPGTTLATFAVTPGLMQTATPSIDYTMYRITTPLFYTSRAFVYWTGSLKFKLRLVASRFHRGRLQLVYFPRAGGLTPATDVTNSTWNTIIDIATDKEVEVEIPWTQSNPWLPTSEVELGADPEFMGANGVLHLNVLNELSGGTTSTPDVNILVTVSAGPDFKMAKPYINRLYNLLPAYYYGTRGSGAFQIVYQNDIAAASSFVNYNGTAPMTELQSGDGAAGIVESNESWPGEHFGEVYTSLRPLIKRYSLYCSVHGEYIGANNIGLSLPQAPYDFMEWRPASAAFDGMGFPTFFTYFKKMYLGHRGSHRYKVTTGNTSSNTGAAFRNARVVLSDSVPTNLIEGIRPEAFEAGSGAEIVPIDTNNSLEFEVPYYYPQNFTLSDALNDNMYGNTTDLVTSNSSALVILDTGANATGDPAYDHEVYAAAGEDMNFFFFKFPPRLARINPGRGRQTITAVPA